MEKQGCVSIDLLNEICSNAEMGRYTLRALIGITKDSEFRKVLARQFAEYQLILDDSEEMLMRLGRVPKRLSGMVRGSVHASLKLNVTIDSTSSHMAEMVMQGSTIGIIDIIRALNEYNAAAEEVKELGKKLLKMEENNFEEMKAYL